MAIQVEYIDVGNMSMKEAEATINKARIKMGWKPTKPLSWFFGICLTAGFM